MPPRGRPTGPTPEAEALIVRHGPIFDHFAHRWCLKADLPDGTRATTIFDLAPNLRTIHIHPAAIPTYSVVLSPKDTHRLAAVCHTPGQVATFTSSGTGLAVAWGPDGITMSSTAHHHQLTLVYKHHAADALTLVTTELVDRLPAAHYEAAS